MTTVVKIRRVGNSNVISLPREFEAQGFTPGTTVLIETLPSGELRVSPAETVRRITRERANQLVAENREALALLATQDGVAADAEPATED